ncbi:DegT/DnrJ/EryC1/StrS family aminotransferase [Acinetobacter piscicola]|uniref:DegT/DnrJ/EryC1/StrS family aminotransferase n=1 Tax=Acinetobacter piscicola TaxID=2006115 RepID=UPI000B7FB6ED|nr:aminotransferase class I/II-fold pyridoxal phosphate-dependent enzyme [Acinetobacter piscicola]
MIPIFKPYMPNDILSELENILYSGQLAYGKYGKLFESELAKFIGNPYVISVNSYNQAMLLALSILNLNPGDEVISSPVSCLASNQPFVIKGLRVIWADVDPETGSLCVDDVKKRITSKTKAIFHNHFCGYLGDIAAINQLAKERGIWVVDDCIEAFGSEYDTQKAGNLGADLTVFSFQTVRLPNTVDGAAISFSSKELYEKAILMRDYGIDRKNFRTSTGEINPNCDITLEGYGATLSEINSYIGLKQMDNLPKLLEKQRKNAIDWNNRIREVSSIKPLNLISDTQPNYWVFGVLCEDKAQALQNFRNQHWYATGVHINNNIYSVFNNFENLNGVNEFINKFLALPCGWWVNFNE